MKVYTLIKVLFLFVLYIFAYYFKQFRPILFYII